MIAKIPMEGSVGELVKKFQSNGLICRLAAVDCGATVGMGTGVAGTTVADNTSPLVMVPVALIVSVPVTAMVGAVVSVSVGVTAPCATIEYRAVSAEYWFVVWAGVLPNNPQAMVNKSAGKEPRYIGLWSPI